MSLSRLLRPRSAVFIGGSVVEEAIGHTRQNGFSGKLYVVNPFKPSLAGLTCYASLTDLPEAPDIAYIGVAKELVVETIQALSDMGCGAAVCNSSGFSEIEGEGRQRQQAFVEAAGSMPVLGPNCPGMANYVDRCVFMQGYFGDHSSVTKGVAVISNGGAYLSDVGTAQRSVPLAYAFGLGNQAVVNVVDVFEEVLDDDRVLAVNLYFESIQNVAKLSRVALKALRKGVPVVVVKGGFSPAGRRAAQTHTASLAGDAEIASALFERLGFIQCNSPDEALETLKMLIFTGRPKSGRLAFSTSSGTYAVLGSDMAERVGLTLPALAEEQAEALAPLLPDYILPSNPLDISNGQYFARDQQRSIYKALFVGDFDIAVLVMCFPPEGGWDPATWNQLADAFATEAKNRNLPCAFVNTLAENMPESTRQRMIDNGMVPLQGLQHGFQAIANSVEFSRIQAKHGKACDNDILVPKIAFAEADSLTVPFLDEYAGKQLLAEIGITVPKSIFLENSLPGKDNLREQLTDLRFPVAVNAISNELRHKTEMGAVWLNRLDSSEVEFAIKTMKTTIQTPVISGFLVEEMVTDGIAEILLGISRNETVGQMLTLAMGGVLVELLQDARNLILPASREQIEQALRRLQLFPVINGYRNKAQADIDQLVATIKRLSDYAFQHREPLHTLEINPLIIRPEPFAPVAVDVVLQTHTGDFL